MPNVQLTRIENINYPFKEGDFTFLASAKNERGEEILIVSYKEKKFTLEIKKREKDYIVKADKITAVLPIWIIQEAIKIFAQKSKGEILFSNVETKRKRAKKLSPYLKDIEFFFNEFEPNGKKIFIEIGFGSGRHLLYQAKKNPDALLIGLEIHRPSIDQILRRCEAEKVENISVINYDARIFLEFMESNSVDKIFIHFPVPWDKKPHRRVISEDFINEAIRVLKKEGSLELRTDSENYFRYSLDLFLNLSKTSLKVYKNRELEISSKYEDRWKRLNKNIYDLVFINEEISQKKEKPSPLLFENSVLFSKIKKKFKNEVIREKDFFIHFEKIYEIDETSGILKVSFGAYQKSEHFYIYITKDKIEYIPNNILPSKANRKAHQKIKEWIYG